MDGKEKKESKEESRLGSGRPGERACGLRKGLAGALLKVKG